MYTTDELKAIVRKFETCEGDAEITPLGPGFINDTFIVKVDGEPKYILQRKNHHVFPDVPGMMYNIDRITCHIRNKIAQRGGDTSREVLTLVRRREESMTAAEREMTAGDLCFCDGLGNWWTMSVFILRSKTYERADTAELAFKGGKGIGAFQSMLADFEIPLNETIRGFHNIRWRFRQWDEAVAADRAGRVSSLQEEIGWIESRREQMMDFWKMLEDGRLPLRVTHNDTKISNILFDENDEVLCVIDLDTCMSSTSLNDFGDAIRSYTNTGAEDDKDLDRVSMSLEMFRAYTEGYLSERKDSMCSMELDSLAFAARYITFEQVLRFLMDYIDGDKYYKTAYPEHNLVRTRAQYRLLQSMEEQYEQMCAIVSGCVSGK